MNSEKKEAIRKSYAFRLKNIITSDYFKKFGSGNEYCQCRIDNMVDRTLNETVSCAYVCNYCEWACCRDATENEQKIICSKCNP